MNIVMAVDMNTVNIYDMKIKGMNLVCLYVHYTDVKTERVVRFCVVRQHLNYLKKKKNSFIN